MGSERVPSLSDGEWGDTGSDSAQEYHHRLVSLLFLDMRSCREKFKKYSNETLFFSKYGPYDYSSYNGRLGDAVRHPVAQKKHQMFGKRYLHDQTSAPNMSQSAANVVPVQSQQNDMPIKYEFEPYPMHHPMATNLDGAAGGMPIMNKHQSQQQQSAADMKYYQVSISSDVSHFPLLTLVDEMCSKQFKIENFCRLSVTITHILYLRLVVQHHAHKHATKRIPKNARMNI